MKTINKSLKILELFAGSRSFTKVAAIMKHITFTSDIKPLKNIDYVCDIIEFKTMKVPFIPDVIWASPDCAAWSKAAGSLHFDSKSLVPKTEKAKQALKQIDKTIEIIFYFLKQNPGLKYFIENPVGKLNWYLQPGSLFSSIPRVVTIDQCQYGREHQKSTHIFTNSYDWLPRKRCPGRPICNHKRNVKDSITGSRSSLGTMDNLSYYQRAYIPEELCREIILSCAEILTKPKKQPIL